MALLPKSFVVGLGLSTVNTDLAQIVVQNLKNEQSSNLYIISLCKQNLLKEALQAFVFLQSKTNFRVELSTYTHLIHACASVTSLQHARLLHGHLKSSGIRPNVIIQNHILNMYRKCGSLKEAQKVFDELPQPNLVSWTSMIAGYSKNNHADEAVELYCSMLRSSVRPDCYTFGSIIRACATREDTVLGKQLHSHVIKSGFSSHIVPLNALIAMYSKLDQISDAIKVFSFNKAKDLISWSSVIAGLSQMGHEVEALSYFREMLSLGVYHPNEFLFGSVLNACSNLLQADYGMQMHGVCIKYGFGGDPFTGCSLCDMYAKCDSLHLAKLVFKRMENPDLVSWNSIMSGFAGAGNTHEVISLFLQMRHSGVIPDEVTFISLLCSLTGPAQIPQGRQIHTCVIKMGFYLYISVCNSLLTMYTKCSDIEEIFRIFEELGNDADLVSWNSILTACMHRCLPGEALKFFKSMQTTANSPDCITLTILPGACAEISSLEMGNQVHCYGVKTGLRNQISVTNALIDMYTKCGCLENARRLFHSMENPDVFSWSSMIMGYTHLGSGDEALRLFKNMMDLDVKKNEVALLAGLTACSRAGQIVEGWKLYKMMRIEHGIVPTREHLSCVVDLLARAGLIPEAEAFISQMEFDPDVLVWKTLLAACEKHGNAEAGTRAAEKILKIDPSNSAAHVLLSNIHASAGNWEEVGRLRSSMREHGIRKDPGCSWIELKDRVHVFLAEDFSHPERSKIYSTLGELWWLMVVAVYDHTRRNVPVTNC